MGAAVDATSHGRSDDRTSRRRNADRDDEVPEGSVGDDGAQLAEGSWQKAVGRRQLAEGSWQKAVGRSWLAEVGWQKAVGRSRLAMAVGRRPASRPSTGGPS